MRVLVTSTPGTGHMNPVAPLAVALRDAGHEVRWATGTEAEARVRRLGIDFVAAGPAVAERIAALQPEMPEIMALPPRRRRGRFFAGLFGWAAPRMRTDLEPVFDAFAPEVVVHETAELAAAPMATARGIPHVTVAFSGVLPDEAQPLVQEAVAPVWDAEGAGPPPPLAGMAEHLYLHPFPPAFGQAPEGPAVRPLAPVAPPADDAPAGLDDLGRARPLLYVTAGTERTTTLFPWGPTLEAVGALDVDALVTIGPTVSPDDLGPVPANVRVERFVPQDAVLARAALVISHAGAGSLLGAARHGRPQLLVPLLADQWENADAATASGAAITLEPDERSQDTIADALRRLLRDDSHRDAARRVAAEIAAMPAPATYVATLAALAEGAAADRRS